MIQLKYFVSRISDRGDLQNIVFVVTNIDKETPSVGCYLCQLRLL